MEAIGTDDPAIDAEVIQLYDMLLGRLGVSEYRLELNSIGCRDCRPAYVERLRAWLDEHGTELDEDARSEGCDEPAARLRRQGSRRTSRERSRRRRRSATRSAPRASSTSPPFAPTSTRTASRYELVPTLVRGLDYYTRTTWEFVGPMDEANSTICGGGRYDGLVEEIGGPPTPGLGFGAGIERLLIAIEDEGGRRRAAEAVDVFIAPSRGRRASSSRRC